MERAYTQFFFSGVKPEFWKKRLRKLALDPIAVPETAKLALLKLPLCASAGLSRVSRNHVVLNWETSVG